MSQPYLSLEAELHDAFWDAEDDGSEVRLMAGFLKKHPGPALEVGSGSGRLMFPLVKMGRTHGQTRSDRRGSDSHRESVCGISVHENG